MRKAQKCEIKAREVGSEGKEQEVEERSRKWRKGAGSGGNEQKVEERSWKWRNGKVHGGKPLKRKGNEWEMEESTQM